MALKNGMKIGLFMKMGHGGPFSQFFQFSTQFSTHFQLKIEMENGMKIGQKSLP